MLIEWREEIGFWKLYIDGKSTHWYSVERVWWRYIVNTSSSFRDNKCFWRLTKAKAYVEAMYWLEN